MDEQVRAFVVWIAVGALVGIVGALVIGGSFAITVSVALAGAVVLGLVVSLATANAALRNPMLADGIAGFAGAVLAVMIWIFVA